MLWQYSAALDYSTKALIVYLLLKLCFPGRPYYLGLNGSFSAMQISSTSPFMLMARTPHAITEQEGTQVHSLKMHASIPCRRATYELLLGSLPGIHDSPWTQNMQCNGHTP